MHEDLRVEGEEITRPLMSRTPESTRPMAGGGKCQQRPQYE